MLLKGKLSCVIGSLLVLAVLVGSTVGFMPPHANRIVLPSPRRTSVLKMCICIDCARVTKCAAYHFVETKHEQPHMTERPTFEPREGSPTIHVNVRTIRNSEDRQREIERMWREHETETEKAMADSDGGPLYGETTYDLSPVTTYEYDVVKCEDFVEDTGCWVRNMPEEIRKANPDFVPS